MILLSDHFKDTLLVYILTYVYLIYFSVNLCNQAIRELTENLKQFVKCLFQSVNLFFYACKTLEPGLFWYAVDANLFRLESTNPKKKFPDQGCTLVGGEAPHQKNIYINFFFGGGCGPPLKSIQGLGIFFRIGGL